MVQPQQCSQLSHAQFPLRRHPIPSSFIDGGRTASVGDPRGADDEGRNPPQVADFISERWPDWIGIRSRTQWDQEKARDICRDYVIERLGDPSGVLVHDETGFLKKRSQTVVVGRQYSGTTGRIENCQLGVFLGYASPRGLVLIDRRLYLPKDWAEDAGRSDKAGVPDNVAFATKPKIDVAMVAAAIAGRRHVCMGARRVGLWQR